MNFSYDSILSALTSQLALLENWTKKILTQGVYYRILSVIAFGLEKLALYGEILVTNTNLKTTTIRQYLIPQVYVLNYVPHRKKGAFGNVKFSADSTFSVASSVYTGDTVFITKWAAVLDTTGESKVYTTEEKVYSKNTVIVNTNIDTLPAVDLTGGRVGIPVTAHGMPAGQGVSIRGSINYDGDYEISVLTTTNEIVITAPFTAETFDGDEEIFTGHIYVSTKQGTPAEFVYTGTGAVNETIGIFDDSIDNDEMEITIVDADGEVLHTVSITTEPILINDITVYYAQVKNFDDYSGINIIFGDDIYTRKLGEGEIVNIKYAITDGLNGNVLEVDKLTVISDPFQTSTGNDADIYVTNDEEISGGDTIEANVSIKANSRNLFGAGYRTGTRNDWITVVNNYPGVLKSVVWTDYDLDNTVVSADQNIVSISAISNEGTDLNVTQQSDISLNYLKDLRDVTDVVMWERLRSINARPLVTARVTNIPFDETKEDIFDTLYEKYAIINADYKTNIYDSALDADVQNVESVIYHATDLWHSEKSEFYLEIDSALSGHEIVVSLPAVVEPDTAKQILIQDETPQLWIQRKIAGVLQTEKQIAQTNVSSSIILEGINSYTIVSGIIDYTDNLVTYIVQDIVTNNPPPGEPDESTIGYQEWAYSAATTAADGSGLANDATVYTANVVVDSVSYPVSIVGSTAQTMQLVVNEINADILGAVASFNTAGGGGNGSIKIISDTWGTASTIVMTDTDLFATITNANPAPDTAVDGTQTGDFGVINPDDSDANGYFMRLVYKTVNGVGDFENDIRLPYFYNITNIEEDDMFYTLSYED